MSNSKDGMVRLRFVGPFPLIQEDSDVLANCPARTSPGIYLLAVRQAAGGWRVCYVGETGRSFYQRLKEHVVQTLGGNYRVCDPEAMRRGEQIVLWDGLWRKGTRDRLPEWLREVECRAKQAADYLRAISAFVAPLNGEARSRKRVEGALADAIRSSELASSLLPADIRYRRRNPRESPIDVSLQLPEAIDGIPSRITA